MANIDEKREMIIDVLEDIKYMLLYRENNNIYHLFDGADMQLYHISSNNRIFYVANKDKISVCNHYKIAKHSIIRTLCRLIRYNKSTTYRKPCSVYDGVFQTNTMCSYCKKIILANPQRYGLKHIGRKPSGPPELKGSAHTYIVNEDRMFVWKPANQQ